MSEIEAKPVVIDPVEPVVAEPQVQPLAPTTDKDFVEGTKPEIEHPVTDLTSTAAPVEETKEEEKSIEPISSGLLAYKGPGLVKSLIPSKKEFWLSDAAVAPENLDLFLRGEKPEIAHPTAAWASQTGKSLLFSTKKNADRAHPTEILALYDATDLKKQSPHEFSFKLNNHNHTFKAANDGERDGWYLSIEKAIELGKASKEEIVGSENYKTEHERLGKPSVVAAATTTSSKPATERTKSPFARFSKKKDETTDKKEEKEIEESKPAEEVAPVIDTAEAAPVSDVVTVATIPAAAVAAEPQTTTDEAVVEEKPKPSKRGSFFGRLMSPTREKGAKEAELGAVESPKDAVVSEDPPQLPENDANPPVVEVPAVQEPAIEASNETETVTPKEKSNFLSGLGFMKRNRSVSPSAVVKDEPKSEDSVVPASETISEPVKVEEHSDAVVATEEPAPVVEEEKKETTPNKRQSVLGNLGRRASKAFRGMQAPNKKENVPAASEATKEEDLTAVEASTNPVVTGEAPEIKPAVENSIGDVTPEVVNVGQAQPVTASA